MTMAVTIFAQQVGPAAADDVFKLDSRWFFIAPTAEDLMDSLWRVQDLEREAHLESFRRGSQRRVQLYQMALSRYLQELPRLQISPSTWQRWWDDFGRQQEHFWRMWQAHFSELFERHLETIWATPHRRYVVKTIPLSGVPTISLTHEFGDVMVWSSPKGVSRLVAEIKVVATSSDDAQKYLQEIDVQVVPKDSILKVATLLPSQRPETVEATSITLELELPPECPLQLESSFGDVHIAGFTRGIRARTSHGSLEIRQCSGNLDLANRYGEITVTEGKGTLRAQTSFNPIEVSAIQGDVFAGNEFAPVRVKKVTGSVQVENSAGLIEAVDIDGNVTLHNHLGQVVVHGVAGNLTVDNAGSPVIIAEVGGATHIESRRGEIRAEKLRGDVVILNEEGDVHLALDEIRQHLYRLDSSFGIVRLNLPPSPSVFISAEAHYGTIDSDFPLEIKRVGPVQSAQGKLGQGKATIQLDGRNSNIYLISSRR